MKVLVTGAEGMLGSALCPELRQRGHEVIPTDLEPRSSDTIQLDVRDEGAIHAVLTSERPRFLLHLAAETDVDRCEREPAHAYLTNAVGTEYLASACGRSRIRMLYVSTAGVFNGLKPTPYVESDQPDPVNVYGRAKLSGEFAVRHHVPSHLIVRAGWMVGGHDRDKKFAGKILQLLQTRNTLSVVTDKIGSPTFTEDLARGIATLIETDHVGVFHMTNHGVCSRYEFACKLVEFLGRPGVTIRPITSEAFPLPAPRAPSEAMANQRLQSLGLDHMPPWQEALRTYVQRYLAHSTLQQV
ncbi:MAG: dTDP-4-dehydrorhamnose reductase [Candidatus Omnitrophota bacterium]|nr:dTDP-4-dehydrorhamnose reductase [Candidatus Omnitrophota bacterium]